MMILSLLSLLKHHHEYNYMQIYAFIFLVYPCCCILLKPEDDNKIKFDVDERQLCHRKTWMAFVGLIFDAKSIISFIVIVSSLPTAGVCVCVLFVVVSSWQKSVKMKTNCLITGVLLLVIILYCVMCRCSCHRDRLWRIFRCCCLCLYLIIAWMRLIRASERMEHVL